MGETAPFQILPKGHTECLGRGILLFVSSLACKVENGGIVGIENETYHIAVGAVKLHVHNAVIHLVNLPNLAGLDFLSEFLHQDI